MKRQPQKLDEMKSIAQMISFDGKVALVTGAAGGIGRASSSAFAEMGAKVILVDVPSKKAELAELAETLHSKWGAECRYITGDISDENSVENIFTQSYEMLGPVTILHNNAGIIAVDDGPDMPAGSWDKIVSVNLTGTFLVARCCARRLKEAGLHGSIVTTASVSASIINTGPGYAATKAGARHMSAALAIEYAKDGIRFNTVSYGYILSGLHESLGSDESIEALYRDMEEKSPIGRIGRLDEVIGPVIYLASDLSSFQTGSDILVDGGFAISRT